MLIISTGMEYIKIKWDYELSYYKIYKKEGNFCKKKYTCKKQKKGLQ